MSYVAVIGSHAIKRHYPNYREPVDIDIVAPYDEIIAFAKGNLETVNEITPSAKGGKVVIKGSGSRIPRSTIIEAEIVKDDNLSTRLYELILSDPKTIYDDVTGLAYASLDVCLMLKLTHRYVKNSVHFIKTMRDIRNLRKMGATNRPDFKAFFDERVKATYWYKHPKLNKGKDDFFKDDGVTYLYDHDSIHKSVKQMNEPAYSFFQSENAEVMCDMKKFFTLDEQIKLNAVYEESCVLALERSIIPFGTNYKSAFLMALEKVCTSITSGKFREYAWENYIPVRNMFDEATFDRFFDDVKNDKIDMGTI